MNWIPYAVVAVISCAVGSWLTYRIMSGTADRLSAGVLRAQGFEGKPVPTQNPGVHTGAPAAQGVPQAHAGVRTAVPSNVSYTPVHRPADRYTEIGPE